MQQNMRVVLSLCRCCCEFFPFPCHVWSRFCSRLIAIPCDYVYCVSVFVKLKVVRSKLQLATPQDTCSRPMTCTILLINHQNMFVVDTCMIHDVYVLCTTCTCMYMYAFHQIDEWWGRTFVKCGTTHDPSSNRRGRRRWFLRSQHRRGPDIDRFWASCEVSIGSVSESEGSEN